MADDLPATEHTLSTLTKADVYKLPPRPDTRGWNCQQWPKENWIFSGRVVIAAIGEKCTIKLVTSHVSIRRPAGCRRLSLLFAA